MKRIIAATLAFAVLSTALFAGGPVTLEAEDEVVVAAKPATSGGWLVPVLLLAVIGLAITSGQDDGPRPCM